MSVFEPVKVDNCSSCGSTIKQYCTASDTIICEHCGLSSSDENPANYLGPTSSHSFSAPDNPLFKLHETFEYDSNTWQVIGCIGYQGLVREWDSEDDTWEVNPWKYNSWWVMNEARELAWVIHDSTGYKWSRKTTLLGGIPKDDINYEEGTWNVVSAVGEFSYFPAIGNTSTTYEKGERSIEILFDANGNKKEVEAFTNTPIKPLSLLQAFDKKGLVEDLKRSRLAFKVIFASFICLLLGYYILQSRSETIVSIPQEHIQHPLANELINLGEFGLDEENLLRFDMRSSLSYGDGSFEADLIIKDDQQQNVSELPITFWRESGYDSDGSWTESKSKSAPLLKLPANKQYTLYLKPTHLGRWKQLTVTGTVQKNVASSTPVYFAGALFVLLLILQWVLRKNFIRKHTGLKL